MSGSRPAGQRHGRGYARWHGASAAAIATLTVILAGCPHLDTDRGVFACASDADCGSGWRCVDHACEDPLAPPPGTRCTPTCAPGLEACCGGACVRLSSDPKNCGACGKACKDLESCAAGRCLREEAAGACANGLDDDGDGLVDCADRLDCPTGTSCGTGGRCCDGACRGETSDERCANGVDDDCDGLVDCQDDGCKGRQCAPGKICGDHGCLAACRIGRTTVAADEPSPIAPCLRCSPALDPHGWSVVPALTQVDGCRGNDACDGAGQCRRTLNQPCAGPGDCASKHCREGRCAP